MALSATTKRYSFRAIHSLDAGSFRERVHGHEFLVEISFEKLRLEDLNAVVEEKILPVLHGRDLTETISPATGENVVEWIQAQLDSTPLRAKILGVALQETKKNRFISARSVPQLV